MTHEFQRDYLVRLPLPLAQLYSRGHNAKDARSRHDNTFYLFEAFIKLAAAPAVMAYLHEVEHGASRVEPLDRLLATLALPSLGQWVSILREITRHFGNRPDAASHPLGHVWDQINTPRRDLPAILALYRRIKHGPDQPPAGDQSCSLLDIFDALVQYRNGVFGHGGPRFPAFYEQEMGPLLFPAANELLAEGIFDLLGPRGSRLVLVSELRVIDGGEVEVGLRELVGTQGERLPPVRLPAERATALAPQRVALLWPGRPVPLRLDPLLVYRESELAEEVLFLNRDRNSRQVEYLSYTTGRTERDRTTAPALATLLGRITRRDVTEEQLRQLAEQSLAETPSVEALTGSPSPAGRLLGDYEVLAQIGRGGMGVVYLARQLSLGRLVALKMLPADLAGDEVALARFRREIRHLARCDHPHIVKVLASGTLPDGQLYYAMEYVPGCDLEQVWRELSAAEGRKSAVTLGQSTWARAVLTASRKQREQTTPKSSDATASGTEAQPLPLPPLPELPSAPDDPGGYARRVAGLVRDAALALQMVHDQGLVHRDVKPANLMLTPDGTRVVLMDFGLVKGQSLTLSASKQGGLLGTLRYAAPEQLAAATLKVGPAADVRGLGITLWELLTRRRLFGEAVDEKQLAQLVHEADVPRLRSIDPGLDRDLEAIVARATERSVADRIATARQLAEYLQMHLDGRPLPIRPPGTVELVRRWVSRRPAVAALVLAVVLVTVAGIAGITLAYGEAQRGWGNALLAKDAAEKASKEAGEARAREAKERTHAEEAVKERDRAALTLMRAETRYDPEMLKLRELFLQRTAEGEARVEQFKRANPKWATWPPLERRRAFEKDNADLDPGIKSILSRELGEVLEYRTNFEEQECGYCHNRPPAFPDTFKLTMRLNEYEIWRTEDKHSHAFAVLEGDWAERIGRRLEVEPTQAKICLNCHAFIQENPRGLVSDIREGVTCIACHGDAREWRFEHADVDASRRWRSLSAEEKERGFGLRDLRDPVKRSTLCLSCHMGSLREGRFVTHAMLEAGHPPLLSFELGTFSESMPRHWQLPRERSAEVRQRLGMRVNPSDCAETRLVILGSVTALRQAVVALSRFGVGADPQTRSSLADFANFDCEACHHPIGALSRGRGEGALRKPGGLSPLKSWLFPLVQVSIEQAAGSQNMGLNYEQVLGLASLELTTEVLQQGEHPKLEQAARTCAEHIGQLLEGLSKLTYTQDTANRMLRGLISIPMGMIEDYDSARQIAWAWQRIYSDLNPKPLADADIKRVLLSLDGELRLTLPSARQRSIETEWLLTLSARRFYDARKFKQRLDELRLLLDR